MQSFDHGYYLLVKSIQELREKKDGLVTVGIGGPSGSGKTRYNVLFLIPPDKYTLFRVFLHSLNCSDMLCIVVLLKLSRESGICNWL